MTEDTSDSNKEKARGHDLIVEGWRFVAHSYAVVNQFQLLEMLRRPGLRLYHRDLPFYGQHWRTLYGLLAETGETALQQIPPPPPGQRVRALYRIGFPYDLSPADQADRTFVFGTSELLSVTEAMLVRPGTLARQMIESETVIITPSQWSKQGFVLSGAPADRIHVIPHGIDPATFKAMDATARTDIRRKLGWAPYFCFLSVGTMKSAKGIRLMLKALATLAVRNPAVRLVLKGSDAMYRSDQLVREMADTLTEQEKQTVLDRIIYLGQPLSFVAMARLYQAADAYLTPYLAEGFNLPALEAAACGLPVICTRGGPTDDFAHPQFFLGVDSRLQKKCLSPTETNYFLVPELDHLIQRMEQVIGDETLRRQARRLLPDWVRERFGWASVVRKLLGVLLSPV